MSLPFAPPAAAPSARTLLRVSGLRMSYGAHLVLGAVDLDVADGEFLTILGPSGSGKTTLLRLIAGLAQPTGGRIELDGRDIAPVPINERPFHTVFQDYALFPHMTVRENVGFGLKVRGLGRREVGPRVRQALVDVEMDGFSERYPSALSGGQRQRVALARALICEPRLILLDEPLSALDATLRRQMQDFLRAVQRRSGITFLFVTHDQSEAIIMSDRICVMADGHVQQLGDPRTLYYRPANEFVAAFFGDNNLLRSVRVASSDDSGAVVDTPLGRLRVAPPHRPLAPGQAATLAVRPESLVLSGPDAPNAFQALVKDVTFVGSETTLALAADGTSLTMKFRSDQASAPPSPGATVFVAFEPQAGFLLPAAP